MGQCEVRGGAVQGGGPGSDETAGAHSITTILKLKNSEMVDLQGIAEKYLGKSCVHFS